MNIDTKPWSHDNAFRRLMRNIDSGLGCGGHPLGSDESAWNAEMILRPGGRRRIAPRYVIADEIFALIGGDLAKAFGIQGR